MRLSIHSREHSQLPKVAIQESQQQAAASMDALSSSSGDQVAGINSNPDTVRDNNNNISQTGRTSKQRNRSISPTTASRTMTAQQQQQPDVVIDEVVSCLLSQGVVSPDYLLNSKPISLSPIELCALEKKQNKDKDKDKEKKIKDKEKVKELRRILRPSLPRTFSSIGLARQEVRDKLGGTGGGGNDSVASLV